MKIILIPKYINNSEQLRKNNYHIIWISGHSDIEGNTIELTNW